MNNSVITVPNKRPIIILIAIPSHISPPLKYNGINPSTVVNVANKIGLKRYRQAAIIASSIGRFNSFSSI